jgi:hypothetical protein
MAEAVDIAGAVLRLIRDPAHLSTTDLGLVHQVLAAMRPIIPPAPGAMDLDGPVPPDPAVRLSHIRILRELEKEADEDKEPVGRGYSEWDRAPDRVFVPEDRVAEYHVHPQRFADKFSLFPAEFDQLYTWVAPALATLPRRRFTLENRLAQALRYMRTGAPQEEIGAWFGCCKTCSNDDIDDVVCVLYNDPNLKNEVRWATQVEGDAIVHQVADWAPNLSGAMICGDVKKRATNRHHVRPSRGPRWCTT